MMIPDIERLSRGRAAVISCPDEDCDICLSACGFKAISAGEDGRPFSDPAKCVGCGGCAAVCPKSAILLIKNRGGGEYELTVPFSGELPEIGDTALLRLPDGKEVTARVIQVIPKRPRTENALVRAAVPAEALGV